MWKVQKVLTYNNFYQEVSQFHYIRENIYKSHLFPIILRYNSFSEENPDE